MGILAVFLPDEDACSLADANLLGAYLSVHGELLAAGGLYQELYETQYARTSPVPADPAA